ncbi:gp38 domain protein [Pseudarthrobacter siccitolerans]|uniref:Gp38 domain protein n=1 Tax=Pseudarthrobacter siccitolerans TaxID=861266 RepID=A0A024GYS0_9MICC|nr:hypothetical protein [Pseudarthrobacter siccitolerans]CCQ44634.1 gp38 domain protein [Pseudarthrobacter siccitolerans]
MTTAEALRTIAATTDAALLPLLREIALWEARVEGIRKEVSKARGDYYRQAREVALGTAQAKVAALKAEAAPLEAIAAAGNWSRFVLVPGGHLHRGFHCSTLRWSTPTGLLPEYSGADEKEIVEIAGEVACTVCFPSAPVDRPTRIPALVEEREAREAEAAARAAKKVAAEAAKIVVGKKVFKTQRAAENEIGWKIENVVSRRYMAAADASHREHLDGLAAEDLAAAKTIAEAIAAAVEGYSVEAILAKKFAAKVKEYRRNGWEIPADASL